MNKSYAHFVQEPDFLHLASKKGSIGSQDRFLQTELVEQALSKETLPEKLREKLSNQKTRAGGPSETRRYFAHLDDTTPVHEKHDKSGQHREKLQQRLQERKGDK